MAAMASKFNFECVIQYYTDQWLLCGHCHVSKCKLFSLVSGHTAIYVLESLPLETWQFPHSNAYVLHEKHTRSNHACPSSIRNRSM